MAYLALYRKYRPTDFNNLVGQEHIVKTLVNQITSDRLGHAYLFTGTRGTGKTTAAKIFAKAVNCLSPINGSPCGKCDACRALSDPSNIDVLEIDAASNNGVNEIRELREKVQYPPVSCKYKVYIVDEVHMLTGAAFNALLKTLEEPPKHAIFILATTEVHKIPATILSRCMRFDFRLIPTERIAKLISEIYDNQGKKYENEAVFAIARAGEGSIRDALSIADIAISYSDGVLTYNDVMEVLGSTNFDVLINFISNILVGDTGKVLEIIDNLGSLGKSMGVLTKDVTAIVRDLIIVKTCSSANKLLGLPQIKFERYKSLVNAVKEERLLRILEIFSESETNLKYTNHPRVAFETTAIKASKPESDYDIDALLSRIKTLEDKVKDGLVLESSKINLENKPSEIKFAQQNKVCSKIKIENSNSEELKGKLLLGIRKLGSEMLWNVLQGVGVEINSNVLTIVCSNTADVDLLDNSQNKNKIKEALNDYDDFELIIKLSAEEKSLDAVDQATERLKKIFGEDIVIIK